MRDISKYEDQTELSSEDGLTKGNCLSACLANLLNINLKDIPNFCYFEDKWFFHFSEFLRKHNYEFEGSYYFNLANTPQTWEGLLELSPGINGIFIASGKSPRAYVKNGHAVLYKEGRLLHDPSPTKAGILTLDYVFLIEPRKL